MRKPFPIFAVLALLLSACNATQPDEVVLSDSTPKLIVRNNTIFEYKPDFCQLAFNNSSSTFRMMTDDMSEYVSVSLERIPTEEGGKVRATQFSWTTRNDLESRKNITLEVLQLKGDVIWLWYPRESIALVLKILE